MNKSRIKKLFLKSIEEDLEHAQRYANDQHFDDLYDIFNSSFGYQLFFPVAADCFSNKLVFQGFCDTFGDIDYCIEDDGDMSFVSANLQSHVRTIRSGMEKITINQLHSFVMRGNRDELRFEDVAEFAKHYNQNDYIVTNYSACKFTWDTVAYFHGKLTKWKEISKLGRSMSWDAANKYFKEMNNQEDEFKVFIENSKYNVINVTN